MRLLLTSFFLVASWGMCTGQANVRNNKYSAAIGKKVSIAEAGQMQVPRGWAQQNSGRRGTLDRDKNEQLVFHVRSGDVWKQESPRNPVERSEISQRGRWPFGKDVWFAFGMTVRSGLPSTAKWVVLGQIHHSPNAGDVRSSPPWAQYLYPGRHFAIQIRQSQEMPLRHNPPPITLFIDPQLERGREYRFVYRLRYDSKDGAMDTWRDGRKIVTYRGPLGYPGKIGPYLKFGIYRAKSSTEMVVVYDHIRIGSSICDVVDTPQSLSDVPYTGCVRP